MATKSKDRTPAKPPATPELRASEILDLTADVLIAELERYRAGEPVNAQVLGKAIEFVKMNQVSSAPVPGSKVSKIEGLTLPFTAQV